ncbi:cytochrome P450 [Ceraceosorus guamensis]|uniref:Cytochrome P450 n=1 Tax=Ceraceosorus guamensis TaxID=1522189 RepID=A0A316VV52_9BASI|nr:cytochrome P450 [Ceraceosorus guamensis]PWN41350.1 cytochrome P450 [Ceraceosorus guamensis]
MGLAFLASVLLLMPLGIALVAAVTFGVALFLQSAYNLTIGEYIVNPWKHIPAATHEGSVLSTMLMGDFGIIKASEPAEQHARWISELGSVFRYRHMFGKPRIFISDPKALLYIHGPGRAYKYPKSTPTRVFLDAVMGEGLISIEGDKHRRQRRIISPAFTNAAVKELQPVMEKHGANLATKIGKIIDGSVDRRKGLVSKTKLQDGETPPDLAVHLHSYKGQVAVVDVLFWASRTALDVIGDAGFNYQFNSLEHGNEDELSEAYNNLMTACMDVDLFQAVTILLSEIPGLNWMRNIPTHRNKTIWSARATSGRYAKSIVARAKAEIAAEAAAAAGIPAGGLKSRRSQASLRTTPSSASLRQRAGHAASVADDSGDDKATNVDDLNPPQPSSRAQSVLTKDAFDDVQTTKSGSLLHRVIRANLAADLRPNERLTDEELEGVPSTFLLAGSETSATQTSWTLRLMAENLDVQERLRAEIMAAKKQHALEGNGAYEGCLLGDVHALPYLECCVKEALRLMTALPSTVREATEDDVVPLSKPYRNSNGKGTFDSVPIPKGHELFTPIAAVGLDTELWGPDAGEYKPERWMNEAKDLPASVKPLPGPGLYSFISGPRNCVGQRFAQTEIKVLLSHMLTNFKFEVVPGWELKQRQMIARRALVIGQEKYGTRMPLIVSRLESSSA